MTIRLAKALAAWETPAFNAVLKAELERLNVKQLPLQQGLSHSSYACDDKIRAVVISVTEGAGLICIKAGIFYTGIIPGCSCADDPAPEDEYAEYCEVQLDIDRQTAATAVRLVPEQPA